MVELISALCIPLLLAGVAVLLLLPGKKGLMDEFLAGVRDGLRTAVSLLPTLIALLSAVAMLRESGLLTWLAAVLAPACARIGLPGELLPLLLIRPFSGGASQALLLDLFETYGADSRVGLIASVLVGSSDTLIYVIAVYFAAVKVKHTRHALPAAWLTSLLCLALSLLACRLFFGDV